MLNADESQQSISRRSMLLGLGGVGAFSVLAARLYYLQVMKSENYQVLSEENRFNYNITIPERGRILDRYGTPLATNKQDFRLVIIPERVKDIDATLARIDRISPLSQATRKRIKKDIREHAKFVPILVDEHLDWNVFSALNMKLPELPGVIPMVGQGRHYPFKGTFAHVLGYVGKASPKALENDKDPLLRQPTFRMGKTGVEQVADLALRGKSGRQKVEVNAFGRTVRVWNNNEAKSDPGQDVWLTLDAQLQEFAARQFGKESGAAVVMDVMTGELRTLLSMPLYDGNLFVSGLSSRQMRVLNNDPKRPQFNKALSGGYPPASTFKMTVMLTALRLEAISPTQKVTCRGKIRMGSRTFHCWKERGHGRVDMHDALKQSCDVYFYDLIQRLDMSEVKKTAHQLGLGQVFDIGLGGQSRGVVPDADWKLQNVKEGWRTGDSLNASIGQGFVLLTPLQLAVMTARIANGQYAVNPTLIVGDELSTYDDLGMDPAHIGFVQNAMHAVCSVPGGSAYNIDGLGVQGVEMAGKTGTGQVRGISIADRLSGAFKNTELEWKYRDHSIFVGYAPYSAPRFAASVLVEHGGSGARKAANICRAILGKALIRDGMQPMAGSMHSGVRN